MMMIAPNSRPRNGGKQRGGRRERGVWRNLREGGGEC